MSSPNPSPSAPITDMSDSFPGSLQTLNRIARGQRHVIFALLGQIAAYVVTGGAPELALLLVTAGFVYGLVAVVRLATALGSSVEAP